MSWVEEKYIGMLSNRLERFTKKGMAWNFRCHICGDSKKDKSKARGYILQRKGSYSYFCHNCGASLSFPKFLQGIDQQMYEEYCVERFRDEKGHITTKQPEPDIGRFLQPKFSKYGPLKQLKTISQLDHTHPAKMYVEKRKIPSNTHYKLFYAPKFKAFVNTLIPEKFIVDETHKDEPRLIIPFLDENKDLFGFQGRSFSKDGVRYITIILNHSKPKIFGLDSIDSTKAVYITEGPLDSLFLENAVAMAGSDASDVACLGNNLVYVYDNEPRNKEIVKKIEKVIEKGHSVVIWPSSLKEKDVNDMVLAGMTPLDVQMMIKANTVKGLQANLALNIWKKV